MKNGAGVLGEAGGRDLAYTTVWPLRAIMTAMAVPNDPLPNTQTFSFFLSGVWVVRWTFWGAATATLPASEPFEAVIALATAYPSAPPAANT